MSVKKWLVWQLIEIHQPAHRAENGFEEISMKGGFAQEFDFEPRGTNERTQNPGKLAAEEKIASQPREEDPTRSGGVAAELAKQLDQSKVAHNAGESNDPDMCELDNGVGTGGKLHIG